MTTLNRKRFLFITREVVPFFYGGIGTQFRSLIKLFRNLGHEVSLLTKKHENFDAEVFKKYYGDISVYFTSFSPEESTILSNMQQQRIAPDNYLYAFSVMESFEDLYETQRPDIVITAEYEAEGTFLLLKARRGKYPETRFVLMVGGLTYHVIETFAADDESTKLELLDAPQNRLTCALEALCVELADEIVVPTRSYWQQVKRQLGVGEKAVIIPNIIETTDFKHPYSIRPNSRLPIILFVGRLDRHKGADILLGAFLKALEENRGFGARLILIGRDCFCQKYNATFRQYWEERIPPDAEEKIEFLGQVDHDRLAHYFYKASLCVFPSRWEVFGIVCLEAMYCGCPVIVSRGTGLEDVLGPSLMEFSVDISNPENAENELREKMIWGMEKILEETEVGDRFRLRAGQLISEAQSKFIALVDNLSEPEKDESFIQPDLFLDCCFETMFTINLSLSGIIRACDEIQDGPKNNPSRYLWLPKKIKTLAKKIRYSSRA